ncbi:hypothetical protein Droror1_Dr00025923 [Drosera rotundifolia]
MNKPDVREHQRRQHHFLLFPSATAATLGGAAKAAAVGGGPQRRASRFQKVSRFDWVGLGFALGFVNWGSVMGQLGICIWVFGSLVVGFESIWVGSIALGKC